jgi:hypothetical protein
MLPINNDSPRACPALERDEINLSRGLAPTRLHLIQHVCW